MFILSGASRSVPVLSLGKRKAVAALLLLFGLFHLIMTPLAMAQQQIAALDLKPVPHLKGSSPSLEEMRSQVSTLQKRRAALQRYMASVDPSSSDYKATERAIWNLNVRLEELTRYIVKTWPSEATPTAGAMPDSGASRMAIKTTDSLFPATPRQVVATAVPADAAQIGCFSEAPPILIKFSDQIATIVLDRNRADVVSRFVGQLWLLSAATASGRVNKTTLQSLQSVQVQEETKRTDKQIGASARAEGSTSNVERPGIINILAFALEHGGVTKENDGTTLTLKTSPYALLAAINGDNSTTYNENPFLTRIDLSASFNVANKTDELANATRNQLSEWTGRFRITNDHTTRSEEFVGFWTKEILPELQRRSVAITTALSSIQPDTLDLDQKLKTRVGAYLKTAGTSANKEGIQKAILCGLKAEVVDKIADGSLVISDQGQQDIASAIDQIRAFETAVVDLRKKIKDKIEELTGKPEVTFRYLNKREPATSDYSSLGFLLEKKMSGGVQVDGNIGASLYHKPNRSMNQQTLRDLVAALSFQINAGRSGLMLSDQDQSQITISFNGRYQRMMENRRVDGKKADIASAQFKLEIPLFMGMSLPFSLTYSNATETNKNDRFRANFGITFDADKLLQLKHAVTGTSTTP